MYMETPNHGCPESSLDWYVLVHPLRALLSMVLCSLLVVEVHALSLGELVDFAADEAGEEFFGEAMGDALAWWGVLVGAVVET